MADEHLLTLLASGVEAWNRWRAEEPDQGLDLSSAILNQADLRGFDLTGVNLSRARLGEADLSEAKLSGADLSFADLRHARLTGATVDGASFMGADLTDADLSDVDFRLVKIIGAKLEGTKLDTKSPAERAKVPDRDLFVYVDSEVLHVGTSPPLVLAGPPPELATTAVGPSEDFVVLIDGELAPEEVQGALTALADYYRKCGGVGLKIRFRLEEAHVEEFARVE